ncbi:hypothetical protein BAE44_0014641 [Dichanthelium oligosanthes]|uniref:Uncharacterized protein n=1 Tax=Dichanthelium oligosanthes TaxID=888268 RepID=A0A1E5VH02_9POAL|nr:hypothetical protein BAE44_0014641 [Dichanthelium oligosanthes]
MRKTSSPSKPCGSCTIGGAATSMCHAAVWRRATGSTYLRREFIQSINGKVLICPASWNLTISVMFPLMRSVLQSASLAVVSGNMHQLCRSAIQVGTP